MSAPSPASESFDLIVVGGGHAGCEAALAAARLGLSTALFSLNLDRIAWQPCNPAVGGPAKSQLVHEVDALGGVNGRLADATAQQKRVLNASRGPAVWALRAQTDKRQYARQMLQLLQHTPNLALREAMVTGLETAGSAEAGDLRITGVRTYFGSAYAAPAVILTTGTFLGGQIWVGNQSMAAGRAGEQAAEGLSEALVNLGFRLDRLKTGTPARVDRRSVALDQLEEQPSDAADRFFSFDPAAWVSGEQMSCLITRTTAATHQLIRDNLHLTPIYGGFIDSKGPRYCPSIEDKIVRFADKESHQIFLEPEGLTTHEYYPNGISTSLPFDIQYALVRSMAGLEDAHILRPGYAIEYDYFDPQQLKSSFETRSIRGLFFAGQINGTTGYEEAAAQGLFAGINAALQAGAKSAWSGDVWVPGREQAYLGVLVDDLITKGVTEPYRMFTSRAEFRLQLREDNADERLTEIGRQLGLVDDIRWDAFNRKRDAVSRETKRLQSIWVSPQNLTAAEAERVLGKPIDHEYSLANLLRRPDVSYTQLMSLDSGKYAAQELHAGVSRETGIPLSANATFESMVIEQVEVLAKYSGYIERQREEIDRAAHYENLRLPIGLDYLEVGALSIEARQKLHKHRPETLGQASRISGITPAAISLLLIYLKKNRLLEFAPSGGERSTRPVREGGL